MNTEGHRQLQWKDWPVLVLAIACAVLAALVALYVVTAPRTQNPGAYAEFGREVDDVALVSTDGTNVQWADLNGRPRLLFFGFTRCPEICPTTVYELSAALEELGPLARDVEVAFVSVDPARDTPEVLAAYFQSFGPQFHGYTGDRAQIDRLVRAFRAFYEHVPTTGDDYTVNHTAITYLIGADGRVVDVIGYGSPHERTVAQLRAFLG